jgi:hypothetical protein
MASCLATGGGGASKSQFCEGASLKWVNQPASTDSDPVAMGLNNTVQQVQNNAGAVQNILKPNR